MTFTLAIIFFIFGACGHVFMTIVQAPVAREFRHKALSNNWSFGDVLEKRDGLNRKYGFIILGKWKAWEQETYGDTRFDTSSVYIYWPFKGY